MGRLYDQMKRDLELRSFSPHTRRTYLACVKRFVLYFHRSPEELGDPEIREYLHYFIKERKVSQGAVTQAYGALKFFMRRHSRGIVKKSCEKKLDKKNGLLYICPC